MFAQTSQRRPSRTTGFSAAVTVTVAVLAAIVLTCSEPVRSESVIRSEGPAAATAPSESTCELDLEGMCITSEANSNTNTTLAESEPTATVEEVSEYGADISFPMHYPAVSTNYPWLPHERTNGTLPTPDRYKGMPVQPLGNKKTFYEEYVQGCVDHYEKNGNNGHLCLSSEEERVLMSLRQPQSMKNYTKTGFTKIRAPDAVFKLLKDFWEANKDREKDESWPTGNSYVNHWQSPSKLINVEDTSNKGGGFALKNSIWNAARDTISEWTGHKLSECSLYGIRVYREGAVLATHVDRLPLVSSAIINVDQDVDEPWPLEVIGHDGKAHNVTMLPGDLVLYESHSILHGRPFPLKGRFMANVFIHFEPIGAIGEDEVWTPGDLPPYIIPGSPEETYWRNQNPLGHNLPEAEKEETKGSQDAHKLAQGGPKDVQKLIENVRANPEVVNARDANGWTPLFEAIRSGTKESVEFLIEQGSDVNARVKKDQTGFSALHYSIQELEENHPVTMLLKEVPHAKNFADGSKS